LFTTERFIISLGKDQGRDLIDRCHVAFDLSDRTTAALTEEIITKTDIAELKLAAPRKKMNVHQTIQCPCWQG